jgi:hypothetical protein
LPPWLRKAKPVEELLPWLYLKGVSSGDFQKALATLLGPNSAGCLNRKPGLAMAFQLMMSAQTKWRKRDGAERLPEVVQGIAFKDGIKQLQTVASSRRHQLSGMTLASRRSGMRAFVCSWAALGYGYSNTGSVFTAAICIRCRCVA